MTPTARLPTSAWPRRPLTQLLRQHGRAALPEVLLAGLLITLLALALALPIALLQVYDRILAQAAHGTWPPPICRA